MIVRTYSRRNQSIPKSFSDCSLNDIVDDGFTESLSQEQPHQDVYNFGFSSQDSSDPFGFLDSDTFGSSQGSLSNGYSEQNDNGGCGGGGVGRKSKKAKNGKRNGGLPVAVKAKKVARSSAVEVVATATLMETQEFGEMMEHVDEVNFALDGLKKGHPVRVRRASLLSLLSICASEQQRRLLRSHGMAKTIIDAVMGLHFDDSSSNLAAAALFYMLTSDGQDDQLMDSPRCIHFLLNLLKPIIPDTSNCQAATIGLKLLALRRDADNQQDRMKSLDSSSTGIVLKVEEILTKWKELKSIGGVGDVIGRPELSPKWIALLTMEKASGTTNPLEETTGIVRKTRGNFKEKLRELGGLDAVFDVLLSCHSVLEARLGPRSHANQYPKDDVKTESLVLLLKSLKIMENATFLSKDNQSHLLGMNVNLNHRKSSSFTEVIISVIKVLSGIFLHKRYGVSSEEMPCNFSDGAGDTCDVATAVGVTVIGDETSSKHFRTERSSSLGKSFSLCQNSQWFSTTRLRNSASTSEASASSLSDTSLLKMRVDSSTSGSCSVASRSSNSEKILVNNGLERSSILGKRPSISVSEDTDIIHLDDSEDPFAFDEDEYEPSKWDLLSGNQKACHMVKSREKYRQLEDGINSELLMSQQESSSGEKLMICQKESTGEKYFSLERINLDTSDELLADCLLTAVKVLMNLTNDNPVGCQQIAACGGLEAMSSLIACHFPLFSSSSSSCTETQDNNLSQSTIEIDPLNRHLTEQQLDFLVAILGLLVNLVEKDSHNRSRLASSSVLLPSGEGVDGENRRDVIPLLCSIFLANRGEDEAAGEGLPGDDEAALLIGEKEAEQTIVEAYSALLLAFLSSESKSIRGAIADLLPEHNVAILVPVLERFLAFHLRLQVISPETHIIVSEVIESCRLP